MDKQKIHEATEYKRKPEDFRDGFNDNFQPLSPLDLSSINNVDGLVKAMGNTSFGGRRVGEAADLLYKMVKDEKCFVVLTLSGAMTIAKMGLLVCDMIDKGMVHAVVSTGALMAHGFIEAIGMTHFKYDESMSDKQLYKRGYNRVYDSLELEKNLDQTEVVMRKVLGSWDREKETCSYLLNRELGRYLDQNTKGRGVLKSAFKKNVPIFVPAFTDSEMGLDLGIYNRKCRIEGEKEIRFNPFLDLDTFADIVERQKRIAIFTIGGGVPRNWAQQVSPYLDIIGSRLKVKTGFKRYTYAIRICPEPAHWGGLSGCTYSEAVSWGKIVPRSQGGDYCEVLSDATIAWPFILKAVMERLEAEGITEINKNLPVVKDLRP